MNRKLIYLTFAIFLSGMFFLRILSGRLEPYPAILFPSGATKINVDSTIHSFKTYHVYALNFEDEEMEIKSTVIPKMPDHYFAILAKNHFGLESHAVDTIYLTFGQYINHSLLRESKVSVGEIFEAKKWFRNILAELQLKDSIIKIKQIENFYDVAKKKKIDQKVIYEKDIILSK